MFRALLLPIFRSTKQLLLQHLVIVTPYCCPLLSWKRWNWFECVVGGVRHPQHTQTGSNWFECVVGGVGHPQHTQTGCGWRTPPSTHSNRFQLSHDSSRQHYGVTITRCCSYSCFVLLKWVIVTPETCRVVVR